MEDIETDLRRAATEIREAGHAGWGNAAEQGAGRIATLRARVAELDEAYEAMISLCHDAEKRADTAKDEADALREVIKWMWRRCKIVLWPLRWAPPAYPLRWAPPAYPLEHDESARKDSRNAIEHEMRRELAALRGEEG